jgi:hypothetical protein
MIDSNDFSQATAIATTALEHRSEGASSPTVVAEACQQPCAPGPAPELPDDLTPIDDAFLNRVRMLASFV